FLPINAYLTIGPRQFFSWTAKFFVQPGSGVSPGALGCSQRNGQSSRGLFGCQACEIAQFDQLGCLRVFYSKFGQSLVKVQEVVACLRRRQIQFGRIVADLPMSAFKAALAPRVFDEDAAHGFGRGGEEVTAVVPALNVVLINQT